MEVIADSTCQNCLVMTEGQESLGVATQCGGNEAGSLACGVTLGLIMGSSPALANEAAVQLNRVKRVTGELHNV